MDDLEWAAWNVNEWPEGDDRIKVAQIQKFDGSSIRLQAPMHFCFSGSTTVISHDQWQQKRLELQNKTDWLGGWQDAPEHKKLSGGNITEGLDRCHTITTMINELLGDHPAIKAAGMQDKVDDMIIALSEVYQAVGGLEDE